MKYSGPPEKIRRREETHMGGHLYELMTKERQRRRKKRGKTSLITSRQKFPLVNRGREFLSDGERSR